MRTLQRRFKQWRAKHGPPNEIFPPRRHRPGEALQTDFTWAGEPGVTIGGEPFDHQLGQSVLPYSNWQSVVVCGSESILALRLGSPGGGVSARPGDPGQQPGVRTLPAPIGP